MTVKTDNKDQLDEFKADHSDSEIAEPVSKGSTKRPADKTDGEKAAKMTKNKMVADLIAKAGKMKVDALKDAHGAFTSVFDGDSTDNSAANKSSIAGFVSKEDVDEIFSGTELTEEFRDKAFTLFETAVNAKVITETARLEEEFEQKVEESVEEKLNEIHEAVEEYINYVADQWMEDNKLAVESGIKAEVTESFLEGLHTLFTEHHVNVPEEETDVIEEMTEVIDELKEKVNEEVEARIDLQKELDTLKTGAILEDAKEGMVDSDKEKLDTLVEAMSYSDVEEFEQKLGVIKENYFGDGKKRKVTVEKDQLINEEIEEDDDNTDTVYEDPAMNVYAKAISRMVKR